MDVTFEPIGIFKWGFRHYCHDNNIKNLKYFGDVLTVQSFWKRRITRTGMQTFSRGRINFTMRESPARMFFLSARVQNPGAERQIKTHRSKAL